jgi:hypothetical protein
MRLASSILALVGSLALAACGGGGGGSDDDDAPTQATFGDLVTDFDTLFATYDGSFPATPVPDMPASGQATYQGTALYSDTATAPTDIISSPTSASRVDLTADFGNAEMSGRLHDFRSANPNSVIAGELSIVDGQIVGNLFDGRVEGALTTDGIAADHTGGNLLGSFLGDDAEAVSGRIFQGSSPTPYSGVFVGDR